MLLSERKFYDTDLLFKIGYRSAFVGNDNLTNAVEKIFTDTRYAESKNFYLTEVCEAYSALGNLEKMIPIIEKLIKEDSSFLPNHAYLILSPAIHKDNQEVCKYVITHLLNYYKLTAQNLDSVFEDLGMLQKMAIMKSGGMKVALIIKDAMQDLQNPEAYVEKVVGNARSLDHDDLT